MLVSCLTIRGYSLEFWFWSLILYILYRSTDDFSTVNVRQRVGMQMPLKSPDIADDQFLPVVVYNAAALKIRLNRGAISGLPELRSSISM